MAINNSAFFSILFNGSPSTTFSPSRGICQRDTLSSFLFILMVEGLGQSITAIVMAGQITGLKLHPGSPTSSHKQLFNDTMFLGKPTIYEVKAFQSILKTFELASRLEINLSKSQLFFFNMPLVLKIHLTYVFGIPKSSLPTKYMGAPLLDNAP